MFRVILLSSLLLAAAAKLQILADEDGASGPNCINVCGGTTGAGKTPWKPSRTYSSKMYTVISTSDCHFIGKPTVVTTLAGGGKDSPTNEVKGASRVFNITPYSFLVYLDKDLEGADVAEWNIDWIAVGYIC